MMRRRILRWFAPAALWLIGWARTARGDWPDEPTVLCTACGDYVPIPDDVLEGRASVDVWLHEHADTHHGAG
jgi:hypothetical protein